MQEMIKELIVIEPHESVDRLVENLIERNQSGNIFSLMTVFFDKEGRICTYWANIVSLTRAIGGLERLKAELLRDDI